MSETDPAEKQLLRPVLRLFPKTMYRRFVEVPLSRKRIDILCLPKHPSLAQTSVELKVKDWRRALWQAILNLQIAQESYFAIWHKYQDRILRQRKLLEQYSIGLIVVDERIARVVIRPKGSIRIVAREQKPAFYKALLSV